MPFSSGTFTSTTSGIPVVTSTVISSTVFNQWRSELDTGLSTCITKDGSQTCTAQIPFAQGVNSTLTTDATSATTGSIITAGGLGVAKAAWIGGLLDVAGKLRVSANGDVILNNTGSALATGATAGFPYLPSCAGTPTGAPTSLTGAKAYVYDSTNDLLYIYNSSWKRVTGMTIKSIQRGTLTITNTNASATATITSVDTTKSELRFLGISQSSDTAFTNVTARINLTNATTITATRIGTSGSVDVSWEVTEWQ